MNKGRLTVVEGEGTDELDPVWCLDEVAASEFLLQTDPTQYRVETTFGTEIPALSGSVALVVMSVPPVETDFEPSSTLAWARWGDWFSALAGEVWRVLEPGGRVAVLSGAGGLRPFRQVSSIVTELLGELGFSLRGEIVRARTLSPGPASPGWWCSPHNPRMVDATDRVVVASKGQLSRWGSESERKAAGLPHESDLDPMTWARDTLDFWTVPVDGYEGAPVEVMRRLVNLHTYRGDLVVDPLCVSPALFSAGRDAGRRVLGVARDADVGEAIAAEVEPGPQQLFGDGI